MESIGGISVNRMIWVATALSLGSLLICWMGCDKANPSILDTVAKYPYTIIFRIGMMYSLFILFLEFLFIKWWLDSSQKASHTRKIWIVGTLSLIAYAFFVSCPDRKVVNYKWAEQAVFVAAITNFLAIMGIFKNIANIRESDPYFLNGCSWLLKKLTFGVFLASMSVGLLIYLGIADIFYKNIVEYCIVISSYLFFWSFIYDFKKTTMEIEHK